MIRHIVASCVCLRGLINIFWFCGMFIRRFKTCRCSRVNWVIDFYISIWYEILFLIMNLCCLYISLLIFALEIVILQVLFSIYVLYSDWYLLLLVKLFYLSKLQICHYYFLTIYIFINFLNIKCPYTLPVYF